MSDLVVAPRRAQAEEPSWRLVPLGDLCRTTSGGTPSRKRPDYFQGPIPWVKSGELTDGPVSEVEELITEEALANSSAKIFPAGTLLIALYGATVGKLGVLTRDAATNQAICAIFPPEELDTRFLFWYLLHRRADLVARAVGGAQPNISQAILRGLDVPVPPIAQQRRIVAEIEKQFSRLDEAVANLKRAKANLRNLRASALNAACEGPWPSIEFGSLARETLVGLDRGRDQQRSVGPGHRYVKMNNVSMDGEIQPEGIVYVDASSQEATRYALRSGDILFNTRNSVELVGKSALVPPALEGALYNNNLMRIRTTPEIDSAFLTMQMCAPVFRRQLARVKRATTSVAAIYLKDLVRVPVIVPPVPEQCRIVAEVERRLSIIREVAAEVDRNSQRAQALRHAVLRRAFAGEPEVRIAA